MDMSHMTDKELKAHLRLHKHIHGQPMNKMDRPGMVAVAERLKHHQLMASLPESDFEKHMKEIKKMRAKAEPKAEAKVPVEGNETTTAQVKKAASPAQVAHRQLFAEYAKSKSKLPFSEFKKGHLHPEMKASVVEKAEMKDLTSAMGAKSKAKKFVVEKALTDAMGTSSDKKSKK